MLLVGGGRGVDVLCHLLLNIYFRKAMDSRVIFYGNGDI